VTLNRLDINVGPTVACTVGIRIGPAIDRVVAGAAGHDVVAGGSSEEVVAGRTVEGVGTAGAGDVDIGNIGGQDDGVVTAQYVTGLRRIAGADHGPVTQVGEREGGPSVSAVLRAEQGKQWQVLIDPQELASRLLPASRNEVPGERHNLTKKLLARIDAAEAVGRRKNTLRGDQIFERQRRLMIVDRLPAAANGNGKIGIRQCRQILSIGCPERQLGRCTDDGAIAQIRQLEGGNPVPAVDRTDELEQCLVVGNLQYLTRRLQKAGGHKITREWHDLPDKIDTTRAAD